MESRIAINRIPTFQRVNIKSSDDYPISIIETENEDFKAIRISDANNVMRYRLMFKNGHLYFQSWDANGNTIVSESQIK